MILYGRADSFSKTLEPVMYDVVKETEKTVTVRQQSSLGRGWTTRVSKTIPPYYADYKDVYAFNPHYGPLFETRNAVLHYMHKVALHNLDAAKERLAEAELKLAQVEAFLS